MYAANSQGKGIGRLVQPFRNLKIPLVKGCPAAGGNGVLFLSSCHSVLDTACPAPNAGESSLIPLT